MSVWNILKQKPIFINRDADRRDVIVTYKYYKANKLIDCLEKNPAVVWRRILNVFPIIVSFTLFSSFGLGKVNINRCIIHSHTCPQYYWIAVQLVYFSRNQFETFWNLFQPVPTCVEFHCLISPISPPILLQCFVIILNQGVCVMGGMSKPID